MKDRAPIHWELYLGLPCGFRDWSKSYFAAFPGTLARRWVGGGSFPLPLGQDQVWEVEQPGRKPASMQDASVVGSDLTCCITSWTLF